jgi:dynein heavy chain, axonemal
LLQILERLPEVYDKSTIEAKDVERTPYVGVALQELGQMNKVLSAIRRDLLELQLGVNGELTMSSAMDDLAHDLYMNIVPQGWLTLAGPSIKRLGEWFEEIIMRCRELDAWVANAFNPPPTVWLGALFNPQSFLTAVMQTAARKNAWPLDKMALDCDVTRKDANEITSEPRDGAFMHGLYLEGARWDITSSCIVQSHFKVLTCQLPVVWLKPVTIDKLETFQKYRCPIYRTRMRGHTYIGTLNLRSEAASCVWILAGVALLLSNA